MASRVVYKVTNPHAVRLAVDPNVHAKAEELLADTERLTPRRTGRLAGSWKLTKEHTASYRVATDVPYAKYVEYGTRGRRGAAMMGRALARARARM